MGVGVGVWLVAIPSLEGVTRSDTKPHRELEIGAALTCQCSNLRPRQRQPGLLMDSGLFGSVKRAVDREPLHLVRYITSLIPPAFGTLHPSIMSYRRKSN